MKKSILCFSGAMLALSCILLLGSCRQNTDVITLSYANFPPDSTFPCVQMERWKQEVEKRSNGRIKVNTFPGGTLLGAKDIFDGVVAGTADIGNFAMSYQPGRFPASEAIDLPHFFANAQTASRILADMLAEFKPDEFREVKILTVFTCPPGVVMSTQKASTAADLQGLSLRSAGTLLEPMKLLGSIPVAMPQSEVPDALQKGLIKGIVSSAEVLKDMNYAKYCKSVLLANLPVTSFAVVMNQKKYDSLPDDLKAILDGLYYEQSKWTAEYVDQHVENSLAWARDEQQVQTATLNAEVIAELKTTLEPIFSAYRKKLQGRNIDAQALLDFINSHPAMKE